ncbi:PRTRC system protein A [Burkholderia anthina]|uniref:PRTRC system protein A n=1 Tax=Burkholderia anthina TaxID=179879 RepID=UPI001AA056CB|nr:PRTRC system protein A [Burkholderia anthina]QTD91785.1 PRTRC system protein A [Burkholderia anthina]
MSKIESIKATFEAATADTLRALGEALTQFSAQVAEEVKSGQARPIAAKADDANISLDEALFDSAPVAAVPRHAEFAPLLDIGHRFLLAAEGLFVEIRRPWLHLIQPIAPIEAGSPRPPYGAIEPKIEFVFGRLGAAAPHFRRFGEDARGASPNEHAAWIVWDNEKQELAYRDLEIGSTTPGSITFKRPTLADHESLVIDLHSHGAAPAFFSSTDNADDAGEVKISGVLGGLAAGVEKNVVFRLCALGKIIQLKVPVSAFAPAVEEAA